MYATHNVRKSVVTEKSFTNLRNKIYKHMTPLSKNV